MHAGLEKLRSSISSVYLGRPEVIDRLLVCLLARGHCLIEDVPGVGKTVLASALAKSIDCSFGRVQLTPDLLPTDILGVSIYKRDADKFEFKRGPVFASIVLADEINRATPRTQTALLEAMSEGAVTVDGQTYSLPQPFMIVATQNPSDFHGTYQLPENQLDRFLMRINLGYPSPADEARVLELRPASHTLPELRPAIDGPEVLALQQSTDAVRVDRSLTDYIIAIANATRKYESLQLGISPRGALALAQAARATAVLRGRTYCVPEDITENVVAVGAHRIIARGSLSDTSSEHAASLLTEILSKVPSPA